MSRTRFALSLAVAAIAGGAITLELCASGQHLPPPDSNVAFPENHAQGIMYMTVNRAVNPMSAAGLENIARVDDFYITPAAVHALRRGELVPSGTVITRVQHRAQLDAHGNPLKDANGRFIKGALFGFGVMEKRTGWGDHSPPESRTGEWRFQAFTPDKNPNRNVNLDSCVRCHKPLASKDYLFSFDRIKAMAAKQVVD